MKKKRLAILSMLAAMAMLSSIGLSACTDPTPGPGPGPDLDPDTEFTGRADTRQDAYTAYSSTGESLGNFKTLADAINAAVAEDADNGETFGSYVTKIGETRVMFRNRQGYEGTGTGNDDMFWYYENGTMLDGMDCWDAAGSIALLQNSDLITYEVSRYGTIARQSWNGYDLLDAYGEEIDAATQTAKSWELSSTMDAAVLQMTSRLQGVTGLNYEIDLSQVRITPPYDGADSVYAFLGFYSWQDYYVVVTGIACDTRTGDWYAFEATSRDDSFSNAQYNIGEVLMTSTWNEEGGYWTPDCDSLTMDIRTTLNEDDMGTYQLNILNINFSDGTTYRREIDDALTNDLFSRPLGPENGYIFVAGLDIKNEVVSGVTVECTDYFNGAKFENLTVTKATAHVPSADEMTEVQYGYTINMEPGDYDILMASEGEKEENAYDYTILNTAACVTYTAQNGTDVYSFSYDNSPAADEMYGSTAGPYQYAIDVLSAVTVENVFEYEEAIETVGLLYGQDDQGTGSMLHQRIYNVLDFTPYLTARDLLSQAADLSEEAAAVAERFNALGNIVNYTYNGWEAPEDAESTQGYLYTELLAYREMAAAYAAFSSEDQSAFFYRVSRQAWDAWAQLSTDMEALMATDTWTNGVFEAYAEVMSSTEITEFTAQEALDRLLYWGFRLKNGTPFDAEAGENDDPNNGGNTLMCFDNSTFPSLYIVTFVTQFEEMGVELPQLVQEMLTAIGYDDFYTGAYYPLFHTVQLAQYIVTNNVTTLAELTEEQMAFLNDVWGADYELSGQIAWNWNSGNKFETFYSGRVARIALMAGGTLTRETTNEDGTTVTTAYRVRDYFDVVANLLTDNGYTVKANGWGVEEESISAQAEDSDAAKAVTELVAAITDPAAFVYAGWEAPEGATDITGYLYSYMLYVKSVSDQYNALTGPEKAYVALNADRTNYNAWMEMYNEFTALMAEDAFVNGTISIYETPMSTTLVSQNSTYALTELIYWANRIKDKTPFDAALGENDDPNTYPDYQGYMNLDSSTYPSLRIISIVEYFEGLGLELPGYVEDLLVAIQYDEFYNGVYYPLVNTIQLAQRIVTENITSLTMLTEEELAFLNEVWVSDYTISGLIAWNWNSGNKFESHYSGRVARIAMIAGGTLTDADGAYKTYQYFEVVANLLADAGYTINENGWGVTVEEITAIVLSENAQAVADEFLKMGAVNDYNSYIGWESLATETDPAQIKGYLKNEIDHFTNVVLPAYNALTSDDQAALREFVGTSNFEGWQLLAQEMNALLQNAAFTSLSVSAPVNAAATSAAANVTYTGGEVIQQMLYYSLRLAYGTSWGEGENDQASKTRTDLNADESWMPSFRILFFNEKLEEAGITGLPTLLTTTYASVTASDNSIAFMQDFEYLYHVLSLSAKIRSGEITTVTQEVVDVVNNYMVGMERFAEGGLHWQFTSASTPAGTDFGWRSKTYKLFFGLDSTVNLIEYIQTVTNLVVTECGATLTSSGLGVTAAISLPATTT